MTSCAAASRHGELGIVRRSAALLRRPVLCVSVLAGISGCAPTHPPAAAVPGPIPFGARAAAPPASAAAAPLPAAHSGRIMRLARGIAAREYRVSENGAGLQAPNRRHNLRTYFDAAGIRVHDRTAAGSPALLALSLVGVGRGEPLTPPAPGELVSEGARVEIRRPDLVEWYANSPAGLEHGFALRERPEGEGALALELAVRVAQVSLDGTDAAFRTPTGRRLGYGGLTAFDAEGRALTARFAAGGAGRLRILLDDAGAAYPVTIDPLLSGTPDAQLESDQADANLGVSVAGAGDVNDDGYADVIVGAYRYDAGETDEGAAFVFLGSASGIADGDPGTADAQLESDQADAWLGNSVAAAGDVNDDGYDDVIVGALRYDASEMDEGAAFVFLGSASGIADGDPGTAHAQLESDQAGALFGSAVAGAGDVNFDGYDDVIAGAAYYSAGEALEGAAFVFLGSASGIADGDPGTAHAQLESDQENALLGSSVAGAGHVNSDNYADVIVGAPLYEDPAGDADEGTAFVFLGSASGIADGDPGTAHARLESDQADAHLGESVAGAGDVNDDGYDDVIVGARLYDKGQTDEGAAFLFFGSFVGVVGSTPATAATTLESDQAGAYLGSAVAGAGDVNDDGYDDVVVGAHAYADGEANEGAAFAFLGGASGVANATPATAYAQLQSDQTGALLGNSVAGAGDVNDDGYDDVIAGAHLYDADETDEGAAFVYLPEPGFAFSLAAGLSLLALLDRRRARIGRRRLRRRPDPQFQFRPFANPPALGRRGIAKRPR